MQHASPHTPKIVTALAALSALFALLLALTQGQPAEAHEGTCNVSAYLSVPDASTNPTFGGDGTCSFAHTMTIGAYLFLDGRQVSDYSNTTGDPTTSFSIRWTYYRPTPCGLLDGILGTSHTWSVRAQLLVGDPSGGWGDHPVGGYWGYTERRITCPIL